MRIPRLLSAPEPTLWGADGRMYLFDTVVSATARQMCSAEHGTDLALLKAVLLVARSLARPGAEAGGTAALHSALHRHRILVTSDWAHQAVAAYTTVLAALEIVRVEESV